MDELDLIAADPLESPAPTEAEIATALGFIADLLALTPTTTREWEHRDHGNGLTYRLWDALAAIPALVLRGERSDLLTAATVARMQALHAGLTAVSVPGRGHAPMLDEPAAVAAIDAFLREVGA